MRSILPTQSTFAFGTLRLCQRIRAFTLVETMSSLGLLTLLTVSVTWAFSQMNSSASSNRVYSCAQMVAQNYVDAFLSAEPYNPQLPPQSPSPAPTPQLPQFSASPVCTMAAPQSCGPVTVTIYTDPAGSLTVTGNLSLAVADLALTQTTNSVTQNLNARQLRVTLNYMFKGKAYSVVLNTIRVSDF